MSCHVVCSCNRRPSPASTDHALETRTGLPAPLRRQPGAAGDPRPDSGSVESGDLTGEADSWRKGRVVGEVTARGVGWGRTKVRLGPIRWYANYASKSSF